MSINFGKKTRIISLNKKSISNFKQYSLNYVLVRRKDRRNSRFKEVIRNSSEIKRDGKGKKVKEKENYESFK